MRNKTTNNDDRQTFLLALEQLNRSRQRVDLSNTQLSLKDCYTLLLELGYSLEKWHKTISGADCRWDFSQKGYPTLCAQADFYHGSLLVYFPPEKELFEGEIEALKELIKNYGKHLPI